MKISDLLKDFQKRAPFSTAEDWDNVGLLIGDPGETVKKALVSIDLTAEVLAEAKKQGATLIVNHHPCIFPKGRGSSHLIAGNLSFEAARAGISVVALHTNFDRCALEAVDAIAQGLGIHPEGRLFDHGHDALCRIIVFVPETSAEKVRQALCDAGAGVIGNYDQCSFLTKGEGTFRGNADTHPAVGKPGQLERTPELKMETVFPKGLQRQVLQALYESHPYEEPAFDLLALQNDPPKRGVVSGLGYGFWGKLQEPCSWKDWVKRVQKTFEIESFQIPSEPPALVKSAAFSPGKGSSFVSSAAANRVDVFVTGEVGYHSALDGAKRGVSVLELGHPQSELYFLKTVTRWLTKVGVEAHTHQGFPRTLL